jgi:hypothetical protein
MVYVSPAAQKELIAPEKPFSAKREFEQIIRSIRSIAAKSRMFSGELIEELVKQTQSSGNTQWRYTVGGAFAQLGITVAVFAAAQKTGFTKNKKLEQMLSALNIGTTCGNMAQSALSANQFSYQAEGQKIQQALTQYNTFDQRMQGLISNIDAAKQRVQQIEDRNHQ